MGSTSWTLSGGHRLSWCHLIWMGRHFLGSCPAGTTRVPLLHFSPSLVPVLWPQTTSSLRAGPTFGSPHAEPWPRPHKDSFIHLFMQQVFIKVWNTWGGFRGHPCSDRPYSAVGDRQQTREQRTWQCLEKQCRRGAVVSRESAPAWGLLRMLGKVVTTRDAGKMVSTRDGRKCGLCKGCWERRSLPGMLGNVVSTGHVQKCILCKASGKCSVWRELGKLASDIGCHTERRKEGRMLVTQSLCRPCVTLLP